MWFLKFRSYYTQYHLEVIDKQKSKVLAGFLYGG